MAERLDDLPPLGELLANGESPETLLTTLFAGQPYEILETHPLQFRCSCSRVRSRQAIKLLGRSDVEELLAEGEAIIDCHFCHERYLFDRSDLQAILDEMADNN
jgi:molecular chaperone Hsp33